MLRSGGSYRKDRGLRSDGKAVQIPYHRQRKDRSGNDDERRGGADRSSERAVCGPADSHILYVRDTADHCIQHIDPYHFEGSLCQGRKTDWGEMRVGALKGRIWTRR